MTKILAPIGISVLVVTAIVLGYTIIQQSPNQQSTTPKFPTNNSTATAPTTNQPSAEEIAVLNFPGPNATQEEIKEHSRIVVLLAKKGKVLTLNNCKPQPLVLSVTPQTTFTIKNEGSASTTIHYGGRQFVVPANGEKQIVVNKDFGPGLGLFGYACDNKGIAGVVASYSE